MKHELTGTSYVDHMASTGEMEIRRFEMYEIRMKCFISEVIVRKHKKSFNSGKQEWKQRCCSGLCTAYEIKETYFVTALTSDYTRIRYGFTLHKDTFYGFDASTDFTFRSSRFKYPLFF